MIIVDIGSGGIRYSSYSLIMRITMISIIRLMGSKQTFLNRTCKSTNRASDSYQSKILIHSTNWDKLLGTEMTRAQASARTRRVEKLE
jgi:hypothetical protein